MKRNFSRSNVNESTLQISAPGRSSFDLSSDVSCSLPLGRFVPVRCEHLLPSSVLVGQISPEMTLKEIGVPEIGPLRLDTHTIAVSKRRINKDWVKVVKGSVASQPWFDSSKLFGQILTVLLSSDHKAPGLTSLPTFSSLLRGLLSSSATTTGNAALCELMLKRAASFYYQQVNSSTDLSYYNRDFYSFEHLRLLKLTDQYNASSTIQVDESSVFDILLEIMRPYFGPGSIMDHLGFPTFHKNSRSYLWGKSMLIGFGADVHPTSYTTTQIDALFGYTTDKILRICKYSISGVTLATLSIGYADEKYYYSSEWDVRACYAAWYDSLRNWHVEESAKLPNPDDWATQSIFYQGGDVTSLDFSKWCCFLVPRYRMYQNDMFSTIQTDDVFRHIFAPIFTVPGSVRDDDYGVNYDSIVELTDTLNSSLNVLFPFGFFNKDSVISTFGHSDAYVNDLQTMRRAGMLEKYCARNYFFPDTFEGKMQARYGIDASDLLGVTSKYIEGGESFITGQQTMNATATTEMPAGSRTFQGGSAIDGNTFSFAAGGDDVILVTFCSWMPIVTYSATNPHLSEIYASDIVAPEFASDTRVQIQAMNLVRDMEHDESFIGYVPRYVTYRSRLNEVHGEYLEDKRSFVWLRDYAGTLVRNSNGTIAPVQYLSQFAINAYDLRVRMNLDGFLNLQPWDNISYGKIKFNYSIDNPLPAAVEII